MSTIPASSGAGLPGMPDVWAADEVAMAAIRRNRVAHARCLPVSVVAAAEGAGGAAGAAGAGGGESRRVGLLLDDGTMAAHQPLPRHAWAGCAGAAPAAMPGALTTFAAAISANERPERTLAAAAGLRASGLAARCVPLAGRAATAEELRRVHGEAHVARMLALPVRSAKEEMAAAAAAAAEEEVEVDEEEEVVEGRASDAAAHASLLACGCSYNTVFLNGASVAAARFAAGGCIDAARRVCSGELDAALAVVRPPGHHAEGGAAMGFGLFNSVAAVAADALATGAARRVLIVDWDIHHGNGTQQVFETDDRVLYFSAHGAYLFPAFAREGQAERQAAAHVGAGAGAGFSVNCAWSAEGYGDAEYWALWRRLLLPLADEWQPDLVLVSAGFDSAAGDEEGYLLTPRGYARLLAGLLGTAGGAAAAAAAGGKQQRRVVVVLEGGYNIPAIDNGVQACAAALLGAVEDDAPDDDQLAELRPQAQAEADIEAAVAAQRPYWACLR